MKGNRFVLWTVTLLFVLLAIGCHNTAQGVKADTKRALDKTGEGLEKAGDKIDGHKR
jgi:predicted small secreted protein